MFKPTLTLVKSSDPKKHTPHLLSMFKSLGKNMTCFGPKPSTNPFVIGISEPKNYIGKTGTGNTVFFENAEEFSPYHMEYACRDLMFGYLNEKHVIVSMKEFDSEGKQYPLCAQLEKMASTIITIKDGNPII